MTDHPETTIESAVLAERERIAAAIEHEASICPCVEDAQVIREIALLVRANFSYDAVEKLEEAAEDVRDA
jgi:hypothetical protein